MSTYAGLIGYRNQSARIAKLLGILGHTELRWVYHPDPDKLEKIDLQALAPRAQTTSELSDLFGLDAVFITSPSDTHVDYLKRLVGEVRYLYCEKPPAATLDELAELRNLDDDDKRRIYLNFNYRFSDLAAEAGKLIRSGAIGAPVRFGFVSTHGLGFRDGFERDWRSRAQDPLSGIFGNVAIHYVDLCRWLLGSSTGMRTQPATHSPHSGTVDSVSVEMEFENGCTASIFVSYAAPFINEAQLIFTDGFLALRNGSLYLHRPRDSYDGVGRFVQPPPETLLVTESSRAYYDRSLSRSLDHFTSVVAGSGAFEVRDFELALDSNATIFGA